MKRRRSPQHATRPTTDESGRPHHMRLGPTGHAAATGATAHPRHRPIVHRTSASRSTNSGRSVGRRRSGSRRSHQRRRALPRPAGTAMSLKHRSRPIHRFCANNVVRAGSSHGPHCSADEPRRQRPKGRVRLVFEYPDWYNPGTTETAAVHRQAARCRGRPFARPFTASAF